MTVQEKNGEIYNRGSNFFPFLNFLPTYDFSIQHVLLSLILEGFSVIDRRRKNRVGYVDNLFDFTMLHVFIRKT